MRSSGGRRGGPFKSPVFELVYEDNFILVVDKQAGYLSVPTGDWNRETKGEQTLIGEVKRYLSIKSGRDLGATPIHRLDRDTSGLLVIAKSQKISQRVKEQFSARKPDREYVAIVKGRVAAERGTFRSFLATDDDLNQFSTKRESEGKLAITHYEVVSYLDDATRVRVTLETGRRNQIRVHFSEIGHPVLGDVRYRAALAKHRAWPYPRLALHAARLGFSHPMTRKKLEFTSPLPSEFGRFLESAALSEGQRDR